MTNVPLSPTVSPPSASPGGFNRLRQKLRGSAVGVSRNILGRSVSAAKRDRAFSIELKPLVFLILAAGALLYQHAEERSKGPVGDPKRSIRDVAEGFATYALVNLSKGVYPLYGMLRTLFAAGERPSALEKIQASIQMASMLMLGYAGVWLGNVFNEGARQVEEAGVLDCLNKEGVQEWIASHRAPVAVAPENRTPVQQAAEKLQALKIQLELMNRQVADKASDSAMKQSRKVLTEIQSSLVALMKNPVVADVLPKDNGMAKLQHALSMSEQGYVKLVRFLNPVFSHVIFTVILGLPLIAFINNRLAKKYPQLQGKPVNWLQPVPPAVKQNHAGGDTPSLYIPHVGTLT